MKFSGKYTLLALMAGAGIVIGSTAVQAQTKTVDIDVDVQNTLTLAVVQDLNFGKIAAISDGVNTASILLNADTGVPTIATTGVPALIVTIDATARKVAQISIDDFADGATINMTIQNVTNPTFNAKSFTLSNFTVSFNAGSDAAKTVGTPFTGVVTNGFNSGVNTLDIGAKITTKTTVATYDDGNYDGGFDVLFSY